MSIASTPIGTFIEAHGGYFGGLIRSNNILLAVIWAPKDMGEIKSNWIDDFANAPTANSPHDSAANTLAMAEAGSKLAVWATQLAINGHTDWVIPARDVLEMGYRYLKPTDYATGGYYRDGENPSSVPSGNAYSFDQVAKTSVDIFQGDGTEAFNPSAYWSSTQYSENDAWGQGFTSGSQFYRCKSAELFARAVRLIQVDA